MIYLCPLLEFAWNIPFWSVNIVSSALKILTYTSCIFLGGGSFWSVFSFSYIVVDLTFWRCFFMWPFVVSSNSGKCLLKAFHLTFQVEEMKLLTTVQRNNCQQFSGWFLLFIHKNLIHTITKIIKARTLQWCSWAMQTHVYLLQQLGVYGCYPRKNLLLVKMALWAYAPPVRFHLHPTENGTHRGIHLDHQLLEICQNGDVQRKAGVCWSCFRSITRIFHCGCGFNLNWDVSKVMWCLQLILFVENSFQKVKVKT